jgi:putative tryptophan/tyrosine transport system substrate-binding protein
MRYCTVGIIVFCALGLLAAPWVSAAQQPRKVARVGILAPRLSRSAPFMQAFEQQLHDLGYIEGHNLAIEFRTAEGQMERLPDLAAELVRLQVDVILAAAFEVVLRAARQATSTIPIVMTAVGYDPIAQGYVAGLAHPGGNVTGVFLRQIELTGKRLELLKEAVPQASRIAVLWDALSADQYAAAEEAARVLGLHLQSLELHNPPAYNYEGAFAAAVQGRAEALLMLGSPFFNPERARITNLAAQHRLPAMYHFREFVEVGGLMAYGANLNDIYRLAASYVDRILKGAKPANLPVEQPKKFELLLNLKTAQALGITFPPGLLLLADEVLQ